MVTRKSIASKPAPKRSATKPAAKKAEKKLPPATGKPPKKKEVGKLFGRFSLDFAADRQDVARRTAFAAPLDGRDDANNLALLRLAALGARDAPVRAAAPVDTAIANWTPLGPLAVPNGQTYGGARVLISGRVTSIAPHPTSANIIFIGTSRGGVWRTQDGGDTWTPLGDDQASLAIGALAIGTNDPNVLYAGSGEGNVQLYSTSFQLDSAPGVYLGVGVMRSGDGGANWTLQATALLAGHSFYGIAVDTQNANRAWAATSRGVCRTLDGNNWTALSGNGLPAIGPACLACTDVIVDRGDATGNTVYAAFWGQGIYRSTNATAANPSFAQLTVGLPAGNATSRYSLAQSASSPARKYALIADAADGLKGLYRTLTGSQTDWELCTDSPTIQVYGAFTSDVNVDPTAPDLVYVSGVEVYKCQRQANGTWNVTNVGGAIHPDNHALAIAPSSNQTLYAGNDGGFFVSRDAGATWDDSPNEGLCLLQFEAIDHHPTTDAVVHGGTQDNGTQQFRNSPVFHHSADGDGGYCAISKIDGRNVMHSYYGNSPERSTAGGEYGTYSGIASGLNGRGLFYPPAAISPTSERLAWATTVVNLDDAMGTGGWPGTGIALPGISGRISAVSFASNTVIYCATTTGQVYRLDASGANWAVRALHAAPLPSGQWIWDVQCLPGNVDAIVVVFSGFGLAQHVWRGAVPANGTATWVAVSTGLPDVPMYASAFGSTTQWFVGTDIGVFRSTDGGAHWSNYSQGLPNTAIYDLRLRPGSNLLRAATHGRGLWELRTDLVQQPSVDIFLRDHVMDAGRPPAVAPVPAAWADPTRQIALGDNCWWWHCADIKVDAPPAWQLQAGEDDYRGFETKLVHEHAEKGNQNRVYVQVNNRGPLPASNVTVKVMVAGASAGLPPLPADFWTAWPNSAGNANWSTVGAPKAIAQVDPLRPTVLQWDWTPAFNADDHTCMLVVIDSPSDPIPASTKTVFDIGQLVTTEKHAALKNLHLVDLQANAIKIVPIKLWPSTWMKGPYAVRLPAAGDKQWITGWMLSKSIAKRLGASGPPKGLKAASVTTKLLETMRLAWMKGQQHDDASWKALTAAFDMKTIYTVVAGTHAADLPFAVKADGFEQVLLVARSSKVLAAGTAGTALTVVQTCARGAVGGSTFVLRPRG